MFTPAFIIFIILFQFAIKMNKSSAIPITEVLILGIFILYNFYYNTHYFECLFCFSCGALFCQLRKDFTVICADLYRLQVKNNICRNV